ncbi:MAG: type II 3-dehydroquinate dehydratase [Firmicutes bacterium]|nr:type II 3-dehydroquinate dehydratase [Bacillota bacterium]
MKILVINGPSMNMLGIREPELYGMGRLRDLENLIEMRANALGIDCEFFQSNHEGAIVDRIQEAYEDADGIIINAAAYTHTSVAILDALRAVDIPTVEVHLTDINQREDFRKFSYISLYAYKTIVGKGFDGYLEAVDLLAAYDRVRRMEAIMDRVAEAAGGERNEGFDADVKTLEEYYAKNWREDFELDEAGGFPAGMKRGVLSEDGLYDLLEEVK